MTPRQTQMAEVVSRCRNEILGQVRGSGLGQTVSVRLVTGFDRPSLAILVTRTAPDGWSWIEDNPLFFHRKGYVEPKAKVL